MIRSFIILGLLGQDGADKIKSDLLKHPQVLKVEIYVSPKKLIIEMSDYIPIRELQELISVENSYFIREDYKN